MSASPSPTKQFRSQSLVPFERPSSAGDINKLKKSKKGSPQILSKIGDYIKQRRSKNKEEGAVHVKPRCFVDPPSDRHSESPEPNAARAVSAHVGNKHPFKVSKKKDETKQPGAMWNHKGHLKWESDSGRQLMLTNVEVNELSKVEIESLQRQAVTLLQAMDIPVSHGLLKGARGKGQMRSFNTFNRRKVVGNEKQDRPMGVENGIFGQPLTSVLSKDPNRSTSGTSTPVTPNGTLPRTTIHPPSLSPTSTSSSDTSFFDEANATSMLLEALSINNTPSPRTKRRQSLCPADRQVPSIVTKAIDYLDRSGVKMEGLFRISGAKARINEIREMFDSGQDVELTDDMNPHDVACLLKEFFRSLPEPLLTRDLYHPFLATRKLSNTAQRRDALRLLCVLLPSANRDTLQDLLQFLSRVALHSNGIILIDGTEETGNLMTEKNLALIIGPNILHKEVKRKGDNLLQKQEQEELQSVCEVMEDLIRMQGTIFTIPAQLHDTSLRYLATTDPEALDQIMKRKCIQQGLYLNESPNGTLVSRSQSTDALRKTSVNSTSSSTTVDFDFMWRRSRSLSDTQKCLDDAIKSLEQEIADDLSLYQNTLDGDSTDSAMGEMNSPPQSTSEPSTLNRKRDMFMSRDSAFSNNSSPTNSSEGMNSSDLLSLESDSPFPVYSHTRMSSGISGLSTVSTDSPAPGRDSPVHVSSPQLGRKGNLCDTDATSLPALNGKIHRHLSSSTKSNESNGMRVNTLPSPHVAKRNSIKKLKAIPPVQCEYQQSPILNSKEFKFHSETQLHFLSCDHTPTDSSTEIATTSPSRFSLDCESYHSHTEGTVI